MAPDAYGVIIARNIRAARSRVDIGQENVATRMRALGYSAWIRQTVGATERGRRRPTAEEILGLALALETSMPALLAAVPDDEAVNFPGGHLAAKSMERLVTGFNDKSVRWKDDVPVFTAGQSAGWGDIREGRAVADVLNDAAEET